jgi:uncharacterized protein (UPF0548 family)
MRKNTRNGYESDRTVKTQHVRGETRPRKQSHTTVTLLPIVLFSLRQNCRLLAVKDQQWRAIMRLAKEVNTN